MKIKRILVVSCILLGTIFLNGCNTAKGFGQDVEEGGQAIQSAATNATK